ncbi:unnamed protein product [Blepharisma stoltei]|uniref:Uncharacterized protein n=1 Tax=Blepharisma stoltei TaxID=1481888 RepID=A0AAU9IV33_9CILI|nr:unnamed protein product [Blepharisma stoltei]
MSDSKNHKSKSRISKAIESVFSYKGLNNLNGAYVESKIEEIQKTKKFIRKEFLASSLNNLFVPEKGKKSIKAEHFAPITSFAVLTPKLRGYHLFSSRTLPSQFLRTPEKVINNLTKKIYDDQKDIPFPLTLSIKKKPKSKKRLKNPFPVTRTEDTSPIIAIENFQAGQRARTAEPTNRQKLSYGGSMSPEINNFGSTFHSTVKPKTSSGTRSSEEIFMNISASCNDLLQLNKKSKKAIARKTKNLRRGMNRCKNYTTLIDQSNKRASYFILHQKYASCDRPL